ncbi:DMT family transporter [Solirhodobacter olei]|uniref:DMT family transporter n=1 Tax=Solirhodobacter olei TaxID=2493082 RepID=UPI000FD97DC1|nr:EamA family transporter [Solirhodobacter olei]
MLNSGLYALVVLIWGSTWLAIKFQVGVVPPIESVLYRFAIAAALLQGYLLLARPRTRFDRGTHLRFLALGLCLFSLNYLLFYTATAFGLTTGLEAVIFSFLIFMNIANARLMFGERPQPGIRPGALIGLAGSALLFRDEIGAVFAGNATGLAILLSIGGTFLASLGNMASRGLQARKVDVLSANAWGMTYGAGLLFMGALATQGRFAFDPRPGYVLSLLALAIFGSIVAFGAYLTLLGRIGSARAAYATILFPIIALLLSSIFEDYQWTAAKLAGVGLIVLGNFVVLRRRPLVGREGRPVKAA